MVRRPRQECRRSQGGHSGHEPFRIPREGLGREIWNALTRNKQTETWAGVTTTYTYDSSGNRASKAAGGTTEPYSVDDADKPTNIKVGTATIKSYGYNAAGTTTDRRDGDDVLSTVLEARGTKFTPGISWRTGMTSAFYHPDHLGSNTRQTPTAQGSIASRQYDAFGNVAASSGTWTGPFVFAGGYGYQEESDDVKSLVEAGLKKRGMLK